MTVVAVGHEATPDRLSAQVKVTLTSVLFHPAAFGDGVALILIEGGVSSMLMLSVTDAVLPATSVAVPVTAWLAPWVLSVTGEGQVATPESASAQLKLTATEVL